MIRDADGEIFFNSEFDAVSEKTHFSAEFTADADSVAAIVFQLGGKDYYNCTLSNISLLKIS